MLGQMISTEEIFLSLLKAGMSSLRCVNVSFNHRTPNNLVAFIAVGNYIARGLVRSSKSLFILNTINIVFIQKVGEFVSIYF